MGDNNQIANQLIQLAQQLQTVTHSTASQRPRRPKKNQYRRAIESIWLTRYKRIL